MAIRIRVYPQNGAAAYGGYAPNRRASLSRRQLLNERRTHKMRLQYERALMRERTRLVQMQTQLRFSGMGGLQGYGGFGVGQYPMTGAYAGAYGVGASYGIGGYGMGGAYVQPAINAYAMGGFYGGYC